MVGVLPLLAAPSIDERRSCDRAQALGKRFARARSSDAADSSGHRGRGRSCAASPATRRLLLGVVGVERLLRMLARLFDEDEFLSPYGLRALSRWHLEHPFHLDVDGHRAHRSTTSRPSRRPAMFGGNSNWRGPIWFPVNYLVVERARALRAASSATTHASSTRPARGSSATLGEIADDLRRRLISLFLVGADGRRPCFGGVERLQTRPALEGQHPVQRVLPRRQRRRARRLAPDRLDGPRRRPDPSQRGAEVPTLGELLTEARRDADRMIAFGPQVLRQPRRGRRARVARRRRPRRLRDGHGRRPAHPPLPRAARGRRRTGRRAGCSVSRARPGPRRRRRAVPARHDEWAGGVVDPRGHELLAAFELDDGVPRWRWQVGDVVLERELAMVHGRPRGRRRAPPRPRDRPVAARADAALHVARRPRRALRGRRTPRSSRRRTASCSRAPTGSPGPAGEPGGAVVPGVRAREEAARGLERPTRTSGPPARSAPSSTPGDALEVTAAAAPGRRARRGRRGRRSGARRARQLVVDARRRRRRSTQQLVLAADQFVIATRDRPDGGRRLPVVRRVVARHDDVVRGPVPRDRPVRRGPRACCARRPRTLSEGMLANTADTGTLEYNTADGRSGSCTRSAATSRSPATTISAAELAARAGRDRRRHLDGTRFGIGVDPADGLLTPGRRGLGADLDGRPHRRRRRSPRGSASRSRSTRSGSRRSAVAAELLGRADERCDVASRQRRRASFARRFAARRRAWPARRRRRPGRRRRVVRPNQLLAVSLPYGPLAATRRRGAPSTRAGSLLTPLGPALARSRRSRPTGLTTAATPAERDAAYHQGTVWPWLIGPYVDAARPRGVPTSTASLEASTRISASGGSAPSPRRPTARRRTPPPAARSRRGRSPSCSGCDRRKRVQLVLPLLDDAPARLRHLVPRPGEVAERLREHDPRLVGEAVEHGVVRVLVAERVARRC